MFPQSDDPLAETLAAPLRETPAKAAPAKHFDRCSRCAGTGRYGNFGSCFKCKGSGRIEFATSSEQRTKARASRAGRKQRDEQTNLESFQKAQPDVWAWMDGNDFGFASAMVEAVKKWGSLTEKQLAACNSAMQKLAAARAARVDRLADAKPVNVDALELAFAKAAAGAKRAPKLIIGALRIYPASATSSNAGALYVRDTAEGYLGKIVGGKFLRSRECTPQQEAELLAVMADPKAAAIKSGRLTGTCSVCARELTDQVSIDAGIGPVCATKFGW